MRRVGSTSPPEQTLFMNQTVSPKTKRIPTMKILRLLPTFAALVALSSVATFAQDKAEPKAEAKADAKAEAKAPDAAAPATPEKPKVTPEERFKKMDANGDGALNLEEFLGKTKNAEAKTAKEEDFKKLDKDGNGSLSLEEYLAGAARGKKSK